MARLEKTIQDYQKQLEDKNIKNIPEFIQSILDSDITKGKYSRFLLDCFLADKFREEDLKGGLDSTIGQTVSLFHKHKNKLPEDMRSVYKYETPGDLWNAVKQFDGELSGKEIKRSEQDKVYAETEFVYENIDTNLKIISPLTKDAAKWWGRGTRWCTSAEKNNMFYEYAKDAPLLIFLMPGGEKLQLWKNGNDIQFMDEADNKIRIDYIEKNWSILEPVCLWLSDLNFIPKKYRTFEVFENAVKQDGLSIHFIPKKYRTDNILNMAIEQNESALSYFPKEKMTEDFLIFAASRNGKILHVIPDKMKTRKICEQSVRQNGMVLSKVPPKYRNQDICRFAIKQNGNALSFLLSQYRTEELCKLAVQQNGNALQYVPKELKTQELCKMAVKQNGNALDFVPREKRTYEMCELAIKNGIENLKNVPKIYHTNDFCELFNKQIMGKQLKNKNSRYNLDNHEEKYQEIYSLFFKEKHSFKI